MTHSICDAIALAIQTRAGVVVHTGDFKFDDRPPDGELFDTERLRELGEQGVRLLLSDSTNIDVPGSWGASTGSMLRSKVRRSGDREGRRRTVRVERASAETARRIAQATGRFVIPLGRSVATHARVAGRTGYLAWPNGLVVAAEQARDLPPGRVLGVATGTQAEPNAALGRLSRGEHPLGLNPGDHVILASRRPRTRGRGREARIGVPPSRHRGHHPRRRSRRARERSCGP